jgi:RimJ/RimL family protein N-acetyltransferase
MRAILRRARSANPRQLFRAIRPCRIDQLLYLLEIPAGEPLDPIGIQQHSSTPEKLCYTMVRDGQIAHRSFLFSDVLLPAQFGFDPKIPVIGDCFTSDAFRGQGIYPRILRYIVADLSTRGLPPRAYILVTPNNPSSIRGIERAGSRLIAHLKGIRVAGVTFR